MTSGTHDYVNDSRNSKILISINGDIFSREDAKISVFDSGFMLGDGVWEGIRYHRGKLLFLKAHMNRLYEGAKAIDMDIGLSPLEMGERIRVVLEANNMETDVHIRLMVTRGLKSTPYQHPKVTITPPTVVIIPEYKVAIEGKGGTQKMLKRFKSKKFRNKGVLVKFPKRKQDLRIDLPTVGLRTLTHCKSSGLKGIVLKSKRNVFLERKKCISFANKNKMFITVK